MHYPPYQAGNRPCLGCATLMFCVWQCTVSLEVFKLLITKPSLLYFMWERVIFNTTLKQKHLKTMDVLTVNEWQENHFLTIRVNIEEALLLFLLWFLQISVSSSLNSSRLIILLYLVFKTPQMVSNIMSHWNIFKWTLQLTSPSSKWVVF